MVIRVEKSKDYTVMSNHHFKVKEMSLRAKGLLSLMLSLPDEWDYSLKGLEAICAESLPTLRVSLAELEKFGFLKRERKRNEKGLFEYEYIVYEYPYTSLPYTDEPHMDEPHADEPYTEKLTQVNTNISNTKKVNTNKSNTKHTYGEFKKVRLTDDELKKLKDKFPDDWETRIATLDEYIARTGKRYESHYLTILHWARKDAENAEKGKKSYTGFWED